MLCKIADLITEVPVVGGLAPRLRDYQWEGDQIPDIVIRESDYRPDAWRGLSHELYCYMESGTHFYGHLLYHRGMMLHSSAVAYDGRAFLFSGHSGVGKSTHTRLWQKQFGREKAIVFNDDKPALRYLDGRWYAYGTPWCGKDGIQRNMRVPLAGICFLEQGSRNVITELSPEKAISRVIEQTLHKFKTADKAYCMLSCVHELLLNVPCFHFMNQPNESAVATSYEAMLAAAVSRGL